MKTARAALSSLVVCLACTLSLSDAAEPASFDSHLQDSVDFYESGDFERSVQAAEEALKFLDGQSAVAYNNICIARMKLEEYEQAAAACNKALRLAPGYQRAWNNLGWVYEKVVERTPTAGAYLNLSVVRYWQGRLDQSVAASRQALELEPNNAIAHNNICAALAKDGKWKRAIRECETALTIDPEYERAKNNLQWARSGQTD
jgi:tetratricopeptide (TPR) repeat protein